MPATIRVSDMRGAETEESGGDGKMASRNKTRIKRGQNNRALILRADNGSPATTNFSGGDDANTLKLTVNYVIVDLT